MQNFAQRCKILQKNAKFCKSNANKWQKMQNLPKNVQRGTFEPYILIVNLVGIAVFFFAGRITTQVGVDLLWAFPALIFGSWLGVKVYPFINEAVFRKTVLVLILLSGLMLLI